MIATPSVISLAPLLRAGGVKQLFEQLVAARTHPITIDANEVDMMPSLVFQTLLAAEREWQAEHIPFTLINMSEAFCQTLSLLGLDNDHFSSEVAA
ncbi:MAG: STAS domain-containing protein [Litoreibacter sp.]